MVNFLERISIPTSMNIMYSIFHFLILVSLILVVARIFGWMGHRYFGFPTVIGELLTGILIGPYALGSVSIFGFSLIPVEKRGLFEVISSTVPIPISLYMFGQIGIMFLLFYIGMETDIDRFLKEAKSSIFIAAGGVILPFILGYSFILWYYHNFIYSIFMGAILTSTSTAITVRVITDFQRIHSQEGYAILVASVLDDVIGVIVLAISFSLSGQGINIINIIKIIFIIIIFWLVLLLIGLKFHRVLSRFFSIFKDQLTFLSVIILIIFVVSLISQVLGLTVMVGSYALGLAFSRISQKETIIKGLRGLYEFFVPIFFVITGMMVNIAAFPSAFFISIAILFAAFFGKMFGAAIPAMFTGFDVKTSMKIGIGMVPRGEIALTIASNAIFYGLISQDIYAIAILITIVTTIAAPLILAWIYNREMAHGKMAKKFI